MAVQWRTSENGARTMVHSLRFLGMMIPVQPWDEQLRRYKHLEELDFDLVGVADHFVHWAGKQTPWLEGWTLLAALAAQTSRIRLATWVTQIPLRNPGLLARQALTVDHISHGRLELGLGIGLTTDPSVGMLGLPNWSYPERVARFKEYVEIVDRLLSNEMTTYTGKFYQIEAARMDPRPVQRPRPPIVIAANGPIMLKRAAELADNWNTVSYAATLDEQLAETRQRIDAVDEYCAAIGRNTASLRRSYLILDAFRYYGSAQLFSDTMRRFIDLGISEIGIGYPRDAAQLPMFEVIAREMIPRLKEEFSASE
jgi:alkanesulfonate monooxygenase SsuD/methylene tetrahydromethanopterin reductase-like flavin-dependent oxidoreductase (luciferase family)